MGSLIWLSDPEGDFSSRSSVDPDPIRGCNLCNGLGGIVPLNYSQEFPIIGPRGSEPVKIKGNEHVPPRYCAFEIF